MGKQAPLLVALMLASSMGGCLGFGGGNGIFGEEEPRDPLRINHIQMKGTHNSYHVEPLVSPTRPTEKGTTAWSRLFHWTSSLAEG